MAVRDFITGGAALADVPLSGQEEAAVATFPAVTPEQGITSHTLTEHAFTLASYLPQGEPFEAAFLTGTTTNMLLLGLSKQLLDLENFLVVYNSEFIPLDTDIFIEEWERVLGIPDGVFPGPSESDRSIRKLHILVKLASLGVTTVADFAAIPPLLGIPGVLVQSGIDAGFVPVADARFTIVVTFILGLETFPLDFPIPFGNVENQIQIEIITALFEILKPANCQMSFP